MKLICCDEAINELQTICRIRLATKKCSGKCDGCDMNLCICKIEQMPEYVYTFEVKIEQKETN